MTVNEVDLKPFKDASEAVYVKFGYNDLRKKVAEVIAAK